MYNNIRVIGVTAVSIVEQFASPGKSQQQQHIFFFVNIFFFLFFSLKDATMQQQQHMRTYCQQLTIHFKILKEFQH